MAKGNSTVEVVTKLVEPLIEEQGLILWDLRFEKEGTMWLLRVIIDKQDGINIDDCENLSRPLDKLLDQHDPIDQAYCLEVASAGLERELKKPWHFEQSIGKAVVIRLIRPDSDGQKEFLGVLKEYADQTITVDIDGEEKQFDVSSTAYIRWYVEF